MIFAMTKRRTPAPFENRPPLNLEDPLTNPTAGRRCVAALLKKGLNKSTASRELGVAWSTIDKWVLGVNEPDRDNLRAVARLTGYTVAELLEGEAPMPDTVLSRDERASVLRTLNATPDERSAFAEHEDSPDGRYADFTRTYVAQFVLSYRDSRKKGADRDEAIRDAFESAVNADAKAKLKSTGTSSTIPAVEPPSKKKTGSDAPKRA